MSDTRTVPTAPAVPLVRRWPMLLAALVALLAHALLLTGLPDWTPRKPPVATASSPAVVALETRTIAPPEPAPVPEPTPEPVSPPPRKMAAAPTPVRKPTPLRSAPRPPAHVQAARPVPPPDLIPATTAETASHPVVDAATSPASAASGLPADTTAAVDAAAASAASASAPVQVPAAVIATARLAAQVPPSMTLRYAMTGQAKQLQYQANGTLVWANQGEHYSASFTISAFLVGKRTQTSSGSIGPHGLQPEHFADTWRGEKSADFHRQDHVDPAAVQGSVQYSNGNTEQPLMPGAQDQISIFVQLLSLFNAQPHPPGNTFQLQVSDHRRASIWTFRVDPEETVYAVGNPHQAIKLTQVRAAGQQKQIEMWLAPWKSPSGQSVYLPMRMRISEDNGNFVEQVLKDWPE